MGWNPNSVLVLALVAGAVVLGVVAIPLTSQPIFCADCHSIARLFNL